MDPSNGLDEDVRGTWFQTGFVSVHVVKVGNPVPPKIKHC